MTSDRDNSIDESPRAAMRALTRLAVLGVLCVAALALGDDPASAQVGCPDGTVMFDGTADNTRLEVAANWRGGVLPGPTDVACINPRGGEAVTLDSGTLTVDQFVSFTSVIVRGGTLQIGPDNTGALVSTIDGDLTVEGGDVRLGEPGASTDSLNISGNLAVLGGRIRIEDRSTVTGDLRHSAGIAAGRGSLTIDGDVVWSGGQQGESGDGNTLNGLSHGAPGDACGSRSFDITTGADRILLWDIHVYANATWSGTGSILVGDPDAAGANANVEATFNCILDVTGSGDVLRRVPTDTSADLFTDDLRFTLRVGDGRSDLQIGLGTITGATLTNAHLVLYQGDGTIGRFLDGTWTVDANSHLESIGGGHTFTRLDVAGRLTVRASTPTIRSGTVTGSVEVVDPGNLSYRGPVSFGPGSSMSSTGDITIGTDGDVTVTGTWDNAARLTVQGLGTIGFSGGSSPTIALLTLAGRLTGSADIATGDIALTGTLASTGTMTINGTTTSTIRGAITSGILRLENPFTDIATPLSIAADAQIQLVDPDPLLPGGPTLRMTDDVIEGDGVIIVGADTTLAERFPFGGSIVRVPIVVESGGLLAVRGAMELQGGLSTAGTVDITSSGGNPDSSLVVTGDLVQTGGVVQLNETSPDPLVTVSGGTWTITEGMVVGGGQIVGTISLTNSTLAPGASPGTVTVTGDLTLDSASTLAVEIDGPTPGTGYDQVVVIGDTVIDGTITAAVAPAYIPANGMDFVIVDGGGTTSIANATLTDLDTGDNKELTLSSAGSDVVITAATEADLAVGTTVSGTPLTGQTLTFAIQVDNAGPLAAQNVMVTNELPDIVALTNAPAGCTYQPATNLVACQRGIIASGGNSQFTLTGRVTMAGAGDNVTMATSDQNDPTPATDTDTITAPPTADLDVVGFSSTPSPTINDPVSVTAFVSNSGPDDAANITLTADLPTGFGVTTPPAGCTLTSPTEVTCPNLSIASGGLLSITLSGTADELGAQTTTLTATTPDFADADGAQTMVTFTTQPPSGPGTGTADVGVATTITPPTGLATGDPVTLDIVASNTSESNDPSTNTTVTNVLPDHVRLTAVVAGSCGYTPNTNTVVCDVADLAPDTSTTIQLTGVITGPGSFPNTTTITADQNDFFLPNNTDSTTVTVGAAADLTVAAFVSDATPTVGDTLTTTILLTNGGPDIATTITTTVTLSAGYAVATPPAGCTVSGASTVTCATPTLARDAATVIQVLGTSTQPGPGTVTVVAATPDQADPNPTDNTATVAFTASTPPPTSTGGNGGGGGAGVVIPTAAQVTVSLVDVTVAEGNGATTQVEVTAELSEAVDYDVVLTLDITDLTSSGGRDFILPIAFAQLSEILTIKGGDTIATLLVDIVADDVAEPDEQFQVEIISAEPSDTVTIGDAFATVTITDDDPPTNVFGVEPASFSDACVIDPQGLGLQPKTDTELSNSDMALQMLGCTGIPAGGTVVVSRDDQFADSLASGVLQSESPLMLVPTTGIIPEETIGYLEDINPTSVVIIGGDAAVAPDVAEQIQSLGIDVSRRQGATRLETAVDIAATDAPMATTVIIARAFPNPDSTDPTQAFADAISAGGMAADLGYPVLLTQTDVLSEATAAYLAESAVTDVFIMGGTAAISTEVEATLQDMMTGEVTRVTGANRFGTAVATAAIRGTDSAADAAELILVEGQDESAWAAGFAAAYPSAQMNAPIVLVNGDDVPEATADFLTADSPQFAVDTAPPPGQRPLTCATNDDACFAARRLLGFDGVTVTFDPPPLSPAVPGMAIGISTDEPLPGDADVVVDGSCLRDPVTSLDDVEIREDLPPLPCTVDVQITYSSGTVQVVRSAYGEEG